MSDDGRPSTIYWQGMVKAAELIFRISGPIGSLDSLDPSAAVSGSESSNPGAGFSNE